MNSFLLVSLLLYYIVNTHNLVVALMASEIQYLFLNHLIYMIKLEPMHPFPQIIQTFTDSISKTLNQNSTEEKKLGVKSESG